MALLFRKIRRGRWLPPEDGGWIPSDDIPADPLVDMQTKGNRLSVWVIDGDCSNLDRVLAALAGKYKHLDNLDYLLFDEEIIGELRLLSEDALGDSEDDVANCQWHRDLIELTAGRVVDLTRAAYRRGSKTRLLKQDVCCLLGKAVKQKWIEFSKLESGLQNDLRKHIDQFSDDQS